MDVELPSFPAPKPRASLRIFLNSLWVFLLREIRNRYGVSRLGYFWAIFDPVATTGFFVVLHAVIRGGHALIYGEQPTYFFIYGIVTFFTFMHVVTAQTGTLNASRGLFNYRQIRPIDILLARSLIEWGLMVIVFALFAGACWLLDLQLPLEDPAKMLFCIIAVLLLAFSVGFCFEVYATVMPDLRRIFALTTRPLFFISGPFFTIEMVPYEYQAFMLWNPVLHLVDLMRGAALPGYESPGSWSYPLLCTLAFLFVGLAGYRRHMHALI